MAQEKDVGGSTMSFFKDFKGEVEQPLEEPENKDKESTLDEDFLDEDMYKDILAAAEQMLSEESGEAEGEDNNAIDDDSAGIEDKTSNNDNESSDGNVSAKEMANDDSVNLTNNDKDQKAEDTMVDFDENVADEEILDTLLNEEKTETVKAEGKPESIMHTANPNLADEDKDAITVITKGTTINGSIISDCSLDVMGTINGDIECLGKLSISGKVTGNSMASEVYVNTDRLEGCINSEGSVKIGLGTVVIGDITATSGVIAGAVKGEIDIAGPIVIDSTAIIKGNIKAKSVQMNNGAVLEGFCSLSYASVDINDIFE